MRTSHFTVFRMFQIQNFKTFLAFDERLRLKPLITNYYFTFDELFFFHFKIKKMMTDVMPLYKKNFLEQIIGSYNMNHILKPEIANPKSKTHLFSRISVQVYLT